MTIQQKSKAMILLIRPDLPISAGICVVIGQAIALGALPPLPLIWLGFLLGFFLSSSQMIFNDYFDLEVDRINAPQRPLPSGLLSTREMVTFRRRHRGGRVDDRTGRQSLCFSFQLVNSLTSITAGFPAPQIALDSNSAS